jgi:hypothetical protein
MGQVLGSSVDHNIWFLNWKFDEFFRFGSLMFEDVTGL